MGDLREELRKAGLLSEREARRIAHEERVKKSREGRDIKEREAAERHREQQHRQKQKRTSDRRREKENQERARSREAQARVRDRLRSQQIRDGLRGPRRFHFVTRDGSVPFLQVDGALARRLESGEVAIVEMPGEASDFGIVPAAVAKELREIDAQAVRFLAHR